RPKKPRAKKTTAADRKEQHQEPSARRGERTASAKSRKAVKSPKAEPAPKQSAPKAAAPKKKSVAKRKSGTGEAAKAAPKLQITPIEDPIGDVSDGEAWTYTGELPEADAQSQAEVEAYRADVAADAIDGTIEASQTGSETDFDDEAETELAEPAEEYAEDRERSGEASVRPPAKLERLQKILSQSGVASRRHAEEMIVAGRV